MTRAIRALVALVLAAGGLIAVPGIGPAAAGPASNQSLPGIQVPLLAGPPVPHSFVVPPEPRGEVGVDTATINVTYSGFSAPAQAAFQYAADQWEQVIHSAVTINITAQFTNLGSGVLGSAGPNAFHQNRCPAMTPNTYYAEALGNAICGTDLSGNTDGQASFNSNFSNWYFGTNGNTPSGQYDFVSVVMHELGHTLGFLGTMDVSGSTGSWGLGSGSTPAIYDRFTENGAGQALLSFPNNSSQLRAQLVSNNLWFDGPQTTAAGGGTRARLYAPTTWQSGSSYSHLDDATYPAGNANSLMTHSLSSGEAVHNPGPVGLGIMYDQGWTFAPPTAPGAPTGVSASPGNGLAVVSWLPPSSNGGAAINGYTVTSSPGSQTCAWSSGPLSCTVLNVTNGTPHTFTVRATNSVGTGSPSSPSAAVTPGANAGTFTSLTPARILDTRNGTGLSGAFAPNQIRSLMVAGTGGVPASGVDAVVMNVTVTGPTSAGWLTLFPTGATFPTASNLNFVANQTVPNLVVVKVGTAGQVSIANTALPTGPPPGAGSVHVVADVVGYYRAASSGTAAGRYAALNPTRILDTRNNLGLNGAFTANQIRALTVAGTGGVPPSGADAVVLNVTATQSSAAGWLTLFPTGATFATASNLNFVANQTVANLVVVKLGTGGANEGKLSIANTALPTGPPPVSGTVHVIADVLGYYTSAGTNLTAITPARVLDTRSGAGTPVAPNGTITVDPRAGSPLPPVGQYSSVVVNVTVTGPTLAGYLTVYASDAALPATSNVSFTAGQTVPNLVMVRVGTDGRFRISNTRVPSGTQPPSGTVHVVVDVVGFYR